MHQKQGKVGGTMRSIFWAMVAAVVLLVAVVVIEGYVQDWGWTGLPADTGNDVGSQVTQAPYVRVVVTQLQRTLWDWLQLLVVPAGLAVAGLWFTWQQSKRDRTRQDLTTDEGRRLEQNRFYERSVQDYLDRMATLILDKGLKDPAVDENVRRVARAQTITVLQRLDGHHKFSVLNFLYESGLIGGLEYTTGIPRLVPPLLSMKDANLRDLVATHANLEGVDLSDADMASCVLTGVRLNRANLDRTHLEHSRFQDVTFSWSAMELAVLSDCVFQSCIFAPVVYAKDTTFTGSRFFNMTFMRNDQVLTQLTAEQLKGVLIDKT